MRRSTMINEGPAPARGYRRVAGRVALLISAWTAILSPLTSYAGTTNYLVQGVLKEVRLEEHQLVISHGDIPQFMPAMTMPFSVKDASLLTNAAIGDTIAFELHVTESDSWIDHIKRLAAPEGAAKSLD